MAQFLSLQFCFILIVTKCGDSLCISVALSLFDLYLCFYRCM